MTGKEITAEPETKRRRLTVIVGTAVIILVFSLLAYGIYAGPDRVKGSKTRFVLHTVVVGAVAYSTEYDIFPASINNIDNNPRRIEFIDWKGKKAGTDPWGFPISFIVTGTAGAHILDVTSLGRDGKPGGTGLDQDTTATYNEATGTVTYK